VWMCGAEYGGEGGERRRLSYNDLTGDIPTEMGLLTALKFLCGPPHRLTLQCGVS
jgi:hypothetical protein